MIFPGFPLTFLLLKHHTRSPIAYSLGLPEYNLAFLLKVVSAFSFILENMTSNLLIVSCMYWSSVEYLFSGVGMITSIGSLGARPIHASNGVTPVVALTLVLYANVAMGINLSHDLSSLFI